MVRMTVIENSHPTAQPGAPPGDPRIDRHTDRRIDRRTLRILARSLARKFAADGLDTHALLALASELLSEATARLRAERLARG